MAVELYIEKEVDTITPKLAEINGGGITRAMRRVIMAIGRDARQRTRKDMRPGGLGKGPRGGRVPVPKPSPSILTHRGGPLKEAFAFEMLKGGIAAGDLFIKSVPGGGADPAIYGPALARLSAKRGRETAWNPLLKEFHHAERILDHRLEQRLAEYLKQ